MDVYMWQQLSEMKAGILEIASSLSDDRLLDHDKAASKLYDVSKQLHELENFLLRD